MFAKIGDLLETSFMADSICTKHQTKELLQFFFHPIPTRLGHVTLIYGLIPPLAGRNRVKLLNKIN